jgi:DNA-binding XRE family transcriptional regulator
LLIAGDKAGVSQQRFDRELIRKADNRFEAHLLHLEQADKAKRPVEKTQKQRKQAMARNVNELIEALPASRRKKVEKRAANLIQEEMTLQQLRRARTMTEVEMAKNLGVAQKQISEVGKRTDMHICTLRRSIEALGGKLSLVAEFPDRAPVVLSGISATER